MTVLETGAAVDRARRSMEAAQLVAAQAEIIAATCAQTPATDVVVAIVEPDMAFGGVWTLPTERLMAWESRLGDEGWMLIFSPRARVEEVLAQCTSMANLARRRWEALKRRAARTA